MKFWLVYVVSLIAGSIGVIIAMFTNYLNYYDPAQIGMSMFLFSMIVCIYLDNEVRLDKLERVRRR